MATRHIMICGHGSRDANAAAEFKNFAEKIRERLKDDIIEYGYLEFATPIIREGLRALIAKGGRDILAVPAMLFAAGHAKNDIPSVLNRFEHDNPSSRIRYGRELAIDLRLIEAAADRISEVAPAGDKERRYQQLLLVVGRGASDPDANSNVAKVTRMLWEGMGFGYALTAYSGVTFPLVRPALQVAARLGYKEIIVFPYFLFTGILVDRIYRQSEEFARQHPELKIYNSPYLGCHARVVDTLIDRIDEIDKGQNLMNCQLCKYREQFIGFEDEKGLRQESHHHHVEGLLARAAPGDQRDGHGHQHGSHGHEHGSHGHEHGSHGHQHGSHGHQHGSHGHHHPYPHADHPLGACAESSDSP